MIKISPAPRTAVSTPMPFQSSVHPAHFGLVPGAKPVRARPKRGRSPSWDGYFAANKALGSSPFESFLERDFQTLISVDPRIKSYAVQPHELIYWAPDQNGEMVKRGYTPDIVALDQDDRIMIMEVKASFFATHPKWVTREPYIRQAYERDHGVDFLIFTEEEIRAQPRLSNCQLIFSHRAPPNDDQAELTLRGIVGAAQSDIVLGQVCALAEEKGINERRSFSALMRLAMKGTVGFDLSMPISTSTPVKLGG